jgi:GxxExxY protein
MLDASPEIEELAHRVIGAAIEVHRHLGPGFLEAAYEEAMAVELALRGVPFQRQHEIDVLYKGRCVAISRLDLLVDQHLVVELKAVDRISPIHVAQTVSYLSSLGLELGLIINFNVVQLRQGIRRVIRSDDPKWSSRLRVLRVRWPCRGPAAATR